MILQIPNDGQVSTFDTRVLEKQVNFLSQRVN